MCIIMIKPKGVDLPGKDTFRICFNNNSDGCGYMYVDEGKVQIRKGFMGYKNMYKEIKKLGDKNIVVHFRIGTQGKNDQKTCHPYPISNNKEDLQRLKLSTDCGMVHNGIISNMIDSKHPDLNDTQIFIRDILTVFKDLNKEFYNHSMCVEMIEEYIGASKLAFLDTTDEIKTIGTFINEGGILYSNGTYKRSIYSGNSWYGNCYSTYMPGKYLNNTTFGDDYDDDVLDSEIDYDNYIELTQGMKIEYSNGNIMEVTFNDIYGLDSNDNLLKLVNGFPCSIISKKVRVYNQDNEEVFTLY